ncbi:hypothetical protein DNTS_009171 [Danionella cerebrum]|uniref:ERBB receptor feedback inhibitor 1 n=1 Tax=Danionella cerebrum TaxID=2873325 RepID=A0A553QAZ4_9TELE|nr:hypothetical protein DNTS_009171 [Danionella translucida]
MVMDLWPVEERSMCNFPTRSTTFYTQMVTPRHSNVFLPVNKILSQYHDLVIVVKSQSLHVAFKKRAELRGKSLRRYSGIINSLCLALWESVISQLRETLTFLLFGNGGNPLIPELASNIMATAQPVWDQQDAVDKVHGSQLENVSAALLCKRRMFGSCSPPCLSPKTPNPTQLLFPSQCHPPMGDQVVPSLQKLSVYEQIPPCSPRRTTKPLPPLPDIGDLSSDEAEDNEVEFFSSASESQCLVPKTSSFQYGMTGRHSFRGCGQINFGYFEEHRKLCEEAKPQWEQMAIHNQDRSQRRLYRSFSGPAGCFKAALRPFGLHHSPHSHPQDKPEVPPRIPIRPHLGENADGRQVFTSDFDADKPPRIPPREPIPQVIPRAISPKSLPIYVNGVMPPTQSFAPYPEYVSRAQHLPPPRNPCILPIIEDGKKVSNTHYFLLPHRPRYLDKFERFFKESDS